MPLSTMASLRTAVRFDVGLLALMMHNLSHGPGPASIPPVRTRLPAGEPAECLACRLPVHPAPKGQVVERRSGGPVVLRVNVEDEPDRQFGPAQPQVVTQGY